MATLAKFAVQFWGVRGSIPSPKTPAMTREHLRELLIDFERSKTPADTYLNELPVWRTEGYGGDTSCVEVEAGPARLIIDAGSGLRRLGDKLMTGPCGKGQGEVHLLFTHFHWDHVIGLPFFAPIFTAGNKIHIYAVQPELEFCVRRVFEKPFFPVPFEELSASIHFHQLKPRQTQTIGAFKIIPYQLDHPDPCWGYRIEVETTKGRRVYAHAVDNEATRVSPLDLGEDVELYRGADLCFFDAQYTLQEFLEHMNWGHSAAPIGLEIAMREGVKMIYFAHHDPAASDRKITDAERQTKDFLESYRAKARQEGRHLPEIEWHFARDGDRIELGDVLA